MTENLLKQIAQEYGVPSEAVKTIYTYYNKEKRKEVEKLAQKWNLPHQETLKRLIIGLFEIHAPAIKQTLGPGGSIKISENKEKDIKEIAKKYLEKLLKEE